MVFGRNPRSSTLYVQKEDLSIREDLLSYSQLPLSRQTFVFLYFSFCIFFCIWNIRHSSPLRQGFCMVNKKRRNISMCSYDSRKEMVSLLPLSWKPSDVIICSKVCEIPKFSYPLQSLHWRICELCLTFIPIIVCNFLFFLLGKPK